MKINKSNSSTFILKRILILFIVISMAFILFLAIFKFISGKSTQRLNIKNYVAQSLTSCFKTIKDESGSKFCLDQIKQMSIDFPELRFQYWIFDSKNNLLYSNTNDFQLNSKDEFGSTPNAYTLLHERKILSLDASETNGYVDDLKLKKRFVIGNPLNGNDYLRFRRGIILAMFLFFFSGGIISLLFSLAFSIVRGIEAKRVFEKIQNENFDIRFKKEILDDISPFVDSFNSLIDLLVYNIQKLKNTEKNRNHFFKEITHDLRSPLTSILSNVQLLESEKTDRSIKEKIYKSMKNEIEYMDFAVNSLLEIANLELEEAYNDFQRVDIIIFIENLIANYSSINTDLIFKIENKDKLSSIKLLVHPILLKRLFNNLLENALRFTSKSIIIQITKYNSNISISIIDDGPGFNLDQINNLKELSQVDKTDSFISRKHYGLGLIIVFKIVQLFDGKINIQNIPDHGAMVCIEFKT
jgi:signal transduction histidine kinase